MIVNCFYRLLLAVTNKNKAQNSFLTMRLAVCLEKSTSVQTVDASIYFGWWLNHNRTYLLEATFPITNLCGVHSNRQRDGRPGNFTREIIHVIWLLEEIIQLPEERARTRQQMEAFPVRQCGTCWRAKQTINSVFLLAIMFLFPSVAGV